MLISYPVHLAKSVCGFWSTVYSSSALCHRT